MKRKAKHRRGSISIEFVVTFLLITMLFVLLIETMIEVGRANRYQWAKQTCIAAAGAQLDSYAALGRPIDPQTFERLWPHVKVSVETEPGTGPWEGLTRVWVDVQQRIDRKDIHIHQSRYIALPKEAQP